VDRYTDLDSKIFVLSILLSSVFIYNSMGHITENSIEELGLVANLAKLIRLREPEETKEEESADIDEYDDHNTALQDEDDKDEYNKLLPNLFWVLRDFSLDLANFTSAEYLNKCLKKVEGGPEAKKKNDIRDAIKSYFPYRECHPLVRPVFKESDLAHIEDLAYDSLRQEFKAQVETLVSRVMTRPKLKMVGGKYMTGSMLLGIAMEYIEAINSGGVPTILDSFERVAHAEAQKFVDELIEK
jgi:hypothetical protein